MKGSGARRFLLTGGEASRDVVDEETLDESDSSKRSGGNVEGGRNNETIYSVSFFSFRGLFF